MCAAARLRPNYVCAIRYRCRDIGYGVERGVLQGYWTGDTDTWGKRTIRPVNGGPVLYLFPDEIIEVREVRS
jgi:ABC-type microcin C transport system permease subunit YejE